MMYIYDKKTEKKANFENNIVDKKPGFKEKRAPGTNPERMSFPIDK